MTASRAGAPPRLIIGERFRAPCADLSVLALPLDVIAAAAPRRLHCVVASAEDPGAVRYGSIAVGGLLPAETLRLIFEPFAASAGASFALGVFDAPAGGGLDRDALIGRTRHAAHGREPIVLEGAGGLAAHGPEPPLFDEGGLSALRPHAPNGEAAAQDAIRTAYWIDAFWCDAHGVYLRGWVHAHEHRVRSLRLECAGRSAAVERFTERPDLLAFYPEHDHVRWSGFALYLACPPGRPVNAVVETDAGPANLHLVLPEGPVPPWVMADGEGDEPSPRWRLFAELANAQRGPVLQIGARSRERETLAPMRLLRRAVVGFDIHPGHGVHVVGDAHGLGRTVRAGALGGVFSGAVLEHLEAPWVVAAGINRALALGGVVYHHAPMAWPSHAQPNDFWRFTDEGLRILFGEASGFEVLGSALLEPAAVVPAPSWRRDHFDMPTVPAYGGAEIVARKVRDLEPDAIAWPLDATRSAERSRSYPVEALRHRNPSS